MNDLDGAITRYVAGHRTDTLTDLARAVTRLGALDTLAVMTLAAVLVLALRGRPVSAALFAATMIAAEHLNTALKVLFGRDRPGGEWRIGPEYTSGSFPSGHSLLTTVFAFLVLAAVWPALRTRLARTAATGLAVSVAASVGLTRIYLGYHWATDVVAGLVLGALFARVAIYVGAQVERLRPTRPERSWRTLLDDRVPSGRPAPEWDRTVA